MPAHKHWVLMEEFSKDARDTKHPHLRWEFFKHNEWHTCDENMAGWNEDLQFRRKIEIIVVNNFEIENGLEYPSLINDHLFVANPLSNDFYTDNSRLCEERMLNVIKYRLIYRSKEAAIARAKAMLGVNPYE